MEKIIIYSDGGARGNPGPAGVGFILYDENLNKIKESSKFLGKLTNNQAEYLGVILALKESLKFKPRFIDFFLDSELVVKQLKGEYKVKNQELKKFYIEVLSLIKKFQSVNFYYIPRQKNKLADRLVNQVINKNI